jgi:hypothetical protein
MGSPLCAETELTENGHLIKLALGNAVSRYITV